MTRRLVFAALSVLAACPAQVDPNNPLDPSTPKNNMARATLTGTVTLESPEKSEADGGFDQSGALISLEGANVTARTGPDGHFVLAEVLPGDYVLSISKAGYETVREPPMSIPLQYAAANSVDLGGFHLNLSRGSIAGTALLDGESDSTGIAVSVVGTPHVVLTGADGTYLLTGVPEQAGYTLAFTHADFKSASATGLAVDANKTTQAGTVTLSIYPGSVSGMVILTASPQKNDGVTVVATGTTHSGKPYTTSSPAITNEQGAFSLTGIPPGYYDLLVQKLGYRDQHVSAVVAAGANADVGITRLVQATGSIIGVAKLDGQSDNSGTQVLLFAGVAASDADGGTDAGIATTDGGFAQDPFGTALTDRDGTYKFSNVPVGPPYGLAFSHVGYHPTTGTATVVADSASIPSPVTLTTTPGTLTGSVLLEDKGLGADISGTTVSVEGTSLTGQTTKDGSYSIDHVGAGQHSVAVTRAGYTTGRILVSTLPGEIVALPIITLAVARGAVGGTLAAEGRGDGSGIQVSLTGGPSGESYSALTDASGSFLMQGVRVGSYSLTAKLRAYAIYSSPVFQVQAGLTAQFQSATITLSLLRTGQVSGAALLGTADQSGTTVLLSGSDLNGTAVAQSTSTQKDGSYAFTALPEGTYAAAFSHAGYTASALPPAAVAAGATVQLPSVKLLQAKGDVAGQLLLEGATDHSGIVVSVSSGGATVASATSDSGGNFQLSGLSTLGNPYALISKHKDYTPLSITTFSVAADLSTTVPAAPGTLALIRTARIAGTVSLEGGTSSTGVTAVITGSDLNGAAVNTTGSAASDGTFSFGALVAGQYTLALSKTGFVGNTVTGLSLATGQTLTLPAVQLAISRGGVAGKFLLAGATDHSGTLVAAAGASTLTGADGSFTLGGLSSGTFTVTASHLAFASSTSTAFTVTQGSLAQLGSTTLQPDSSGSLSGLVALEGTSSAAGVTVALAGTTFAGKALTASTTSDTSGNYTFLGLVSGSYGLTFTLTSYAAAQLASMAVAPGVAVVASPITLSIARGSLTGTITLAGHTDASGTVVSIAGATAVTATDGSFSFTGLAVGNYTPVAQHTAYVTATLPAYAVTLGATAHASAVQLALDTTGSVAGTATLEGSSSASGIAVALTGSDVNGTAVTLTAITNSSGSYRVATVPAGTYAVDLSKAGYVGVHSGGLTVTPGLALTVSAAALTISRGSVSGQLLLAGLTDASGTTVAIDGTSLTAVTGTDGTFSIGGIPAGTYTYSARHTGYTNFGSASFTIAQGSQLTVPSTAATMALSSGASITGTVALEGGADPTGVVVSLSGTDQTGAAVTKTTAAAKSGAYSLTALAAGNYAIALSFSGYITTSLAAVSLSVGGTYAEPATTLAIARGTVAGTLTAPGASTNSGTLVQIAGTSLVGTTGQDGSFAIASVPAGKYDLVASRTGYSTFTTATQFTVSLGQTTTLTTAALTIDSSASIAGTCTATGASSPVSALQLAGSDFNGKTITSASSTANNGSFTLLSLPAGSYTVTCTHAGFNSAQSGTITLSQGQQATGTTLALSVATGTLAGSVAFSTGTITGFTADSDLSGIGVALTGPSADLARPLVAVTDSAGNYTFSGVPVSFSAAAYTVAATRRGYNATSTTVTALAGQTVSASALSLIVSSANLSGTVTVPAPAADASGVAVVLSGSAFNGTAFSRNADAATNAAGKYTFTGLPSGQYTMVFSLAGFSSVTVGTAVPVPSSSTPPNLLGPSPTLVRGVGDLVGTLTVSDGGSGATTDASGVTVRVNGADLLGVSYQANTDVTGAFSIRNIPVSPTGASYTVTATKTNYVTATSSAVVTATAIPVTVTGLSLAVNVSTVTGIVSVPSPAADASGVTATLSGSFGGVAWSHSSDAPSAADGTFTFTKVPPGTFTLRLSLAGFDTVVVPGITVAPGASIPIAAQALHRSSGNLYGHVALSANGTGLGFAASDSIGVNVTVTGTGLDGSFGTSSDSNGNWTVAAIPVSITGGSYTVTASKAGFISTIQTATVIASSSTQVADFTLSVAPFTLPGSVTVQGATDSAGVTATLAGIAFNGASYSKAASALTNAAGNYTITSVPAGNYSVTLTKNSSYTPLILTPVVVSPPPASLPTLSGTLLRTTGTFSGHVTPGAGSTGLGISAGDSAGITVAVSDGSLAANFGAVTDSAGNYSIAGIPAPLTPGATYTLNVSKAGFAGANGTGTLTSGLPVTVSDIAITALGNTLTGCVVVPSPATDSSGVTASLSGVAFNGTAYVKSANGTSVTDDSCPGKTGRYTFSNVANGSYTIALTRTAYAALSLSGITVAGAAITLPTATLKRDSGSINGTVAFSAGGTGLTLNSTDRTGATVTVTGNDLVGTWTATTDSSGNFTIASIPANVNAGTYTVTVTKAHYVAAGTASVTVTAGQTITAAGLTLTVDAGGLQATLGLLDFASGTTYTAITASLSGIAFNGAAVSAGNQSTNATTGVATWTSLPPGTYALAASLAGHTSVSLPDIPVSGGHTTPVSANLVDQIAPTDPTITSSRLSPTNATSTTISLSQPSSDATAPANNFVPTSGSGSYQYRVCSPKCAATDPWTSWDGSPLPGVPLVSGKDNNIFVYAVDAAQNASGTSVITVHTESIKPGAPLSVQVDNRNGSARIIWSAPAANGSSLPIAGYRVYYGPIAGTGSSWTEYSGSVASQGPSPIDVGSRHEFVFSGLSNTSPFYVKISAYDTVTDPSPNETNPSSGGLLVNPNLAPMDRAVHMAAPSYTNSMSVQRDTVFISSGSASPYTINAYTYDAYGSLVLHSQPTPFTNAQAKVIVADGRALFAFDPAGAGIDEIDIGDIGNIKLNYATDRTGSRVDHLLPLHRGDVGGTGKSHGIITYKDLGTAKQRIEGFTYYPDHLGIGVQNFTLDLHTQTAPYDVQSAGNHIFTLHRGAGWGSVYIDAYTVAADWKSITYDSGISVADPQGGFNYPVAFVVDWPYVYFSSAGSQLSTATLTSAWTSAVTFSAVSKGGNLSSAADRMFVTGGYLYAVEDPGYGQVAVEAFDLSSPTLPLAAGNYQFNVPQELGYLAGIGSAALAGSNLFLLFKSEASDWVYPYYGNSQGELEVVELGGPRLTLNTDATKPDNYGAGAAQIRGSRAIASITDLNTTTAELVDIDLHTASTTGFGGFTRSATWPSTLGGQVDKAGGMGPMVVAGDYAYAVHRDTATVAIYDVSAPPALGAAIVTSAAAPATITALAVTNDYLLAAVDSSSYFERWDLTNITALVGPTTTSVHTQAGGHGIDVYGRYAYVGTSTGFCIVDYRSTPNPVEMSCVTLGTTVGGVHVDAGKLYLSLDYYASPTIKIYDLSNPTSPSALASAPLTGSQIWQFQRLGPYLLSTQHGSSVFTGLAANDLSQAGQPLIGTSAVRLPLPNVFGVSGPFVVVPEYDRGLVLFRMY